ncbi:DoxX family protein [Pseudarthrobacter sp. L19]|uniref:DoxX family protein n=1 Tax=Pseudarthrobacter sp. L19 TaxID=3423951 RepID=UPI003D7A8577
MPFRWSPGATRTLSATALSGLLLASAAKHFRDPGFFAPLVPSYLCRDDSGEQRNGPLAVLSRDEWVAATGLLEGAAAAGLLLPRTRRVSAGCVTALFTVFLTAHVDALRTAFGPEGSPRARTIHGIRLPLQAPLIAWSWSLARAPRQTRR